VDLAFGSFFFAFGQVIEYVLSVPICDLAKHYVDGLFFGTICSLLAIMMVYKFWDGITKEDLEFSVGGKLNTWEIKDPLLNNDSMAHIGKTYGYRSLDTSVSLPPNYRKRLATWHLNNSSHILSLILPFQNNKIQVST
jgi:hypothetical protein